MSIPPRYAELRPLMETLARLRGDAEALAGVVDEIAALELRELRLELRRQRHLADELRAAVELDLHAVTVLTEGLPLASHFPDGKSAPARPTARQVAYLAHLANGQFARQLGPSTGMHVSRHPSLLREHRGRPALRRQVADVDHPTGVPRTRHPRGASRQRPGRRGVPGRWPRGTIRSGPVTWRRAEPTRRRGQRRGRPRRIVGWSTANMATIRS